MRNWVGKLLFIAGCLQGSFCVTNLTSSPVRKEVSTAVHTRQTSPTTPVLERRTDDFYHGLETANGGYNPSPSPQSFNPGGTGPTHQAQVNYISDIMRNYHPGGPYGDPYGQFPGFQGGPQAAGSSQPGQADARQSAIGLQGFTSGPFPQNVPQYPNFNLPAYGNFNPQPAPTQATEGSGPGPTRATSNNPATNDISYFNRFPELPAAPTFPTYNFPDIEGLTRNNTQGTYNPPQDYGNFGSFAQQFPQGFNPYAPGTGEAPNRGNPNGGLPPPGFQYPNYGPQGFPPTQLGQGFPRGFPPQQQPYPNSNAQPGSASTQASQESGLAQPTNTPEQSNPNNPGQFEGYHPRYPYGPPATLPSFSPLRPGSEYGFGYDPRNEQPLRNGSATNAQPFPGLLGYPLYANVGNHNQIQPPTPFYPGFGFTGAAPDFQPPGLGPEYQFPSPGQGQQLSGPPPGYQNLGPPQGLGGSQQQNVPQGFQQPPRFNPEQEYRPSGQGEQQGIQPPASGSRQGSQRSQRGGAPPPRGFPKQTPPTLVDNYGDQQPPGTQGSSSLRDLRRRPVGPGFPQSQGHFHFLPTASPLEESSLAPTTLLTKLKRRGQVMALIGANPKCAKETNATFCLEDPEYPRELVKRALRLSPSSLDLLYKDSSSSSHSAPLTASSETFGARIFPSEDIRSPGSSRNLALDSERKRGPNGDLQGAPCPSSVHYARPLRALSAKGQWKVIVNMKEPELSGDEIAEQIVRLDICSYPSTPCSFSGSSSRASPSRCLQKRKLHRLLAWSESNGLHQEAFYLPVACSCFVSN